MTAQNTVNEVQKQWMHLVSRAWADDALKHRLLTDPIPVLRENGIEVPAGVDVRVVEPSDRQLYLLLPPAPPRSTELTPDELAGVAGGTLSYSKIEWEYTQQSSSGTDSGSSTTSSSCFSCAMF